MNAEPKMQKPRMHITIDRAIDPEDLEAVRMLFREYGDTLGISLESQNFARELAELPGRYLPPAGCLLLARADGEPAGVVGLKPLPDGTCEMKRLYVRPQYRSMRLGRGLVERLIDEARELGYRALRLDTLPRRMGPAVGLYESLGFRRIPAYWDNPLEGVEYMELTL